MSVFESYPYVIHTNRELELMLKGIKPLAVFCADNISGQETFTKEMAQSEQDFSSHVEAGTFHSDHMRLKTKHDQMDIVLDYYAYTLEGERWRANAYFELMTMLRRNGWCQNLERLEGTLLGYSQEQNDYHIGRVYKDNCSQQT